MMGGKVQHGRNTENLPIIQLLAYLFSHFFGGVCNLENRSISSTKNTSKTHHNLLVSIRRHEKKRPKPPQVVLEFFESVDVDPSEAQYLLEVWKGRFWLEDSRMDGWDEDLTVGKRVLEFRAGCVFFYPLVK